MRWLDWAKQIQGIAQTGLAYAKDIYDIERYQMLRELSIEIMSGYTDVNPEQVRMAFAVEDGYATPKVDIRAVVMQEGQILLVREKTDGAWALPGGWADIGLSPFQVAVKEVREESGYMVKAERLLAVMDKQFYGHPPSPHHVYKCFVACSISGGQAEGGMETSEVGFFPLDELPELSLERNTADQIRKAAALYSDPSLPVICD
jgi:ADP-ribose pyrophosphatase YjhB (NUDIX family)